MRFQQPQKPLKLDTQNILVHWQQAQTVISAHEAIIISLKLLKGEQFEWTAVQVQPDAVAGNVMN